MSERELKRGSIISTSHAPTYYKISFSPFAQLGFDLINPAPGTPFSKAATRAPFAEGMASEENTSLPPEEDEVDVKPPAPPGEAEVIGRKEVEVPDCPVHSVVVYPDRAEVCNVACKDMSWKVKNNSSMRIVASPADLYTWLASFFNTCNMEWAWG